MRRTFIRLFRAAMLFAAFAASFVHGEGTSPCAVVWDDRGADAATRFSKSRAVNAVSLLGQGGIDAALFPLSQLGAAVREPCAVVHLVIPDGATVADRKVLDGFCDRGGRIVVHGSFSAVLAGFFGLAKPSVAYADAPKGAEWTGYGFNGPKPLNAPDFVANPTPKVPLLEAASGGGVSVIARWRDSTGKSGPAAVFRGQRGFWLARNFYDNGPAVQRSELLVALTCTLHPPLWKTSTLALEKAAIRDAAPGAKSFFEAVKQIRDEVPAERKVLVETHLEAAAARSDAVAVQCKRGLYGAARSNVAEAARSLRLAAAASRSLASVRGKLTFGVWAPSTRPPACMASWEKTAQALVRAGVDEIMIWTGPIGVSASGPAPGFSEAVAACRKAGLRVTAWVAAFNVESAGETRLKKLEAEKRLLKAPAGDTLNWLDPTVEANVDGLAGAVAALAKECALDGVNLDFIRYPDAATLKKRSPAAIENAVRRVREALRKASPGTRLTASVYGWHPKCVGTVAQDWHRWLGAGLLDAAVPMDYMPTDELFRELVNSQKKYRKRIICGIGASARESWLSPLGALRQMRQAYSMGFAGVAIYRLDDRFMTDFVPVLELAR